MSLFKTDIKRNPPVVGGDPKRPEFTSGMSDPMHPHSNDSVQVPMSSAEYTRILDSQYPHYDALAVVNLKNRR